MALTDEQWGEMNRRTAERTALLKPVVDDLRYDLEDADRAVYYVIYNLIRNDFTITGPNGETITDM